MHYFSLPSHYSSIQSTSIKFIRINILSTFLWNQLISWKTDILLVCSLKALGTACSELPTRLQIGTTWKRTFTNTQTGKSHDGRYGSCGMGGRRGLALTTKYVWVSRLTCGIFKFKEIQILPWNSWAKKKKKRNQRRRLETCLISSEHTVHPLGELTGKPNLHHGDSQTVFLWEWLEETMVFLICGHEMTRLFQSWNSSFVQKFKNFKDFLLTQKTNCQTLLLNGLPFTTYSYCSEKSFWHFLNSECLTLKPAESIVYFGNLQFCSLAELLSVVTLRINVYLKQSKNR